MFAANFCAIVRNSLGDNDFGGVYLLGPARGALYWVVWGNIAFMLFIIFMNFIITEACVIYETVYANLE